MKDKEREREGNHKRKGEKKAMTLSITPYTISTLILIVIIDAIITSGGKVLASLIQSNGNNNLPPTPLPSQCTWPINNTNGSASDQWIVCVPPEDTWNGNVVVFTHGYVLYTTPAPYMPWDMFYIDGQVAIWDVLLNQRFAFAASTFRKNGLAVLEGVEDTETLITWFRTKYPTTKRVYALGVSMGGQISAKLCTTNTNSQQSSSPLVDGCLVACSPIGSYIGIINYWGDYRTVFDYFFPGVLPGNSVDVPDALLEDWLSENSIYQKAVIEAISSDKEATLQLLSVTSSPIGPLEFDTFVPRFF